MHNSASSKACPTQGPGCSHVDFELSGNPNSSSTQFGSMSLMMQTQGKQFSAPSQSSACMSLALSHRFFSSPPQALSNNPKIASDSRRKRAFVVMKTGSTFPTMDFQVFNEFPTLECCTLFEDSKKTRKPPLPP